MLPSTRINASPNIRVDLRVLAADRAYHIGFETREVEEMGRLAVPFVFA